MIKECTVVASRITPDNAVLVLVDFTENLFEMCRPGTRDRIMEGAIALSKIGKLFALPTIVLGEGVDMAGPLVPAVNDPHADGRHIRRSTFSAWDAPEFADAIREIGRKKIILAGIATDVCVTITALDLMRNDYEVYVVADASAAPTEQAELAAFHRLTQAGAILVSWVGLAGEMMGDWQSPYAEGLEAIFGPHIPAMLAAR